MLISNLQSNKVIKNQQATVATQCIWEVLSMSISLRIPFYRCCQLVLCWVILCCTTLTSKAALTNGLVAYYDFQESTVINKAGAVGTDYTGTLVNGTILVPGGAASGFSGNAAFNSTGAAGVGNTSNRSVLLAGNAANFNGTSGSYINVPLGTAQLGQSLSIGVWAYSAIDPNASGARRFVLESVGDFADISLGTAGSASGTATSLTPAYYYNGASLGTISIPNNAATANLGNWQYIVQTVENTGTTSTLTIYVNGIQTAQHTALASSGFTFNSLNFGNARTGSTDRPWDGMLDEVVIYNRAISAGEVASLYETGLAGLAVPEPSTYALLAAGLVGIVAWCRRQVAI
jgi:hypothetical protein